MTFPRLAAVASFSSGVTDAVFLGAGRALFAAAREGRGLACGVAAFALVLVGLAAADLIAAGLAAAGLAVAGLVAGPAGLDSLVADGRVEQAEHGRKGPGRPALMFAAVRQMDRGGPRHYRLLAQILTEALAADLAPRYPSAFELADDLKRFAGGQLVAARRYSPLARAGRFAARHPVAVGLASVVAAGLLALAALSFR